MNPSQLGVITGPESRITRLLTDPEVRQAFHATKLLFPATLDEPFPDSWLWPDCTTVIIPRIHQWNSRDLLQRIHSLSSAAKQLNTTVILHFPFESDIRLLGLSIQPAFHLKL